MLLVWSSHFQPLCNKIHNSNRSLLSNQSTQRQTSRLLLARDSTFIYVLLTSPPTPYVWRAVVSLPERAPGLAASAVLQQLVYVPRRRLRVRGVATPLWLRPLADPRPGLGEHLGHGVAGGGVDSLVPRRLSGGQVLPVGGAVVAGGAGGRGWLALRSVRRALDCSTGGRGGGRGGAALGGAPRGGRRLLQEGAEGPLGLQVRLDIGHQDGVVAPLLAEGAEGLLAVGVDRLVGVRLGRRLHPRWDEHVSAVVAPLRLWTPRWELGHPAAVRVT